MGRWRENVSTKETFVLQNGKNDTDRVYLSVNQLPGNSLHMLLDKKPHYSILKR